MQSFFASQFYFRKISEFWLFYHIFYYYCLHAFFRNTVFCWPLKNIVMEKVQYGIIYSRIRGVFTFKTSDVIETLYLSLFCNNSLITNSWNVILFLQSSLFRHQYKKNGLLLIGFFFSKWLWASIYKVSIKNFFETVSSWCFQECDLFNMICKRSLISSFSLENTVTDGKGNCCSL